MVTIPVEDVPKYNVVGTATWVWGDILATGMPIYLRDNIFYEGFFGLTKKEHFVPRPNPYVALKRQLNILLLSNPATIQKPGIVESICILEQLEQELFLSGICEPFHLDSLIAEEQVEVAKKRLVLRFGEMNEIADKLLEYSAWMQLRAIKKMRNRQSIVIDSLRNESFNTLLDASFSMHVYAHPLTEAGKLYKIQLQNDSQVLKIIHAKITKNDDLLRSYKELFNRNSTPDKESYFSSWRDLEKMVNKKIQELEL